MLVQVVDIYIFPIKEGSKAGCAISKLLNIVIIEVINHVFFTG